MRDTHPIMLEKRIFNLEENGGGSGGTTDYEDLENKPKINNVELIGNVDLSDLGVASTEDVGQIVDDLADLDDKVGEVPEGETVEGQISSINSNLRNLGSNPTILLNQSNPAFGTTYSFNATGYRFVYVWWNSGGWRDCRIFPTGLAYGAYLVSCNNGVGNLRIDITPTTVKLTRWVETSTYTINDLVIQGIK